MTAARRRLDRHLVGAALLFAALGDATALLVGHLSGHGPASISSLADRAAMTRQGVTKHLRCLAAAGLVTGERRGRRARLGRERRPARGDARPAGPRVQGWDDTLDRLRAHVETG
ncbi:MAG: helix-turn-helix domain-containing protein [Vicinamibacterales bacterium]